MENKRFLKIFTSESEYNSQKDTVMGEPHVVYLEDTQTVVYKGIEGGNDEPSEPEVDYSKEYFTIEFIEDGKFQLDYSLSGSGSTVVEYNLNNNIWVELTPGMEGEFFTYAGDTVQLRAISDYLGGTGDFSPFGNIEGKYNVKGNIMSLLYAEDFEGKTDLSSMKPFIYLFYKCVNLVNAKDLVLPAVILSSESYMHMFDGCTSLTTAPELPATTLANDCYFSMFRDCTSLTTAPSVLPATTLAYGCYDRMFRNCTSLTTAPELPATTLAKYCYSYMFYGCTSLTTAPVLPATTLAQNCYNSMFRFCTSLIEAPELPATTLASDCYGYMFQDCTSLTTAPELPATTLANSCYSSMFKGCTSLTTAPELQATTLANYCYYSMFGGCTSLTTTPELPATTLAEGCYSYMFQNCSNLNYIKMLATNISVTNCLYNWVNGVASSGTFVKNANMTSLPNGVSGIPNGWTVENA